MKFKHFATAAIGALLIAVAVPVSAQATTAPSGDAITEITDTTEGQTILAEALGRFQDSASTQRVRLESATEYSVYKGLPGDQADAIWVLPSDAELPQVTMTETSLDVVFAPAVAPDPGNTKLHKTTAEGDNSRAVAAAPYFAYFGATCYARYVPHASIGWQDRCDQWGLVYNDPDTVKAHWVYKQWATCKTTADFYLNYCMVKTTPHSTTGTMYWEDWAPKSDSNGACRTINIGVSLGPVSASSNYEACEQVDITKGAAAGTFENRWVGWVPNSERETSYQIALGDLRSDNKPIVLQPAFNLGYTIRMP